MILISAAFINMGKPACFYWSKFTLCIVHQVEKCFYNLGFAVATHPWWTIWLCWLLVALSSLGSLNFYQEKHPLKLWIPADSDFIKETDYLVNTFKTGYRPQYVIATAPNVLEPAVLAELAKINRDVDNAKGLLNDKEYSWSDVCFKIPVIPDMAMRRKRALGSSLFTDSIFSDETESTPTPKPYEPSIDVDPAIYCDIVNSFELGCVKKSILDLWKYNITTIASLTQDEIIDKINSTKISPVLGHDMEYVSSLGGVERNNDGKIISAKSIILIWFLHVNFSSVDMQKTGNNAGTEVWVSESALAWEEKFIETMGKVAADAPLGLNLFYESGRSYGDISENTMFGDIDKLALGVITMFVYIIIILSKFNWVEMRFILAIFGLICIGMALAVMLGLCSLIGIPYGPVHASLPFLILGLGIDDMFVMKGCWDQLTESDRRLPLANQIGLMLQHAGVSIVITSFTDVVAFLVGSITILPSLQSFCFYAAFGVTFVFVFSVTFYVAIMVLDIQRIRDKRNGAICCIVYPDFTPTDVDQKSISQSILHQLYAKVILSTPAKVVVILFTLIVAGFSVESLLRLEQRFDPAWFISENTYFRKYLNERSIYYPEMGNEGSVYVGAINYTEELPKVFALIENLESETDVVQNIETWTKPFRNYVLLHFEKDVANESLSDSELHTYLSKFLFSRSGAIYQPKFKFSTDLKCGEPAPPIMVSSIEFRFNQFPGPSVYLPAMHRIKDLVRDANFTTGDKFATVWARIFGNWVTDEIIAVEVERNLELALVCVMGCTVLLITDIQMCFWILMCVLLTLVNVCGMMQRWGMTVDTVSCVGLELAVGLCVDYAAHVGHTFLTVQGTRQERAFKTVTSIGAAVLYGGGSMFISISVLCTSDSYIFSTFFKIFFLVIVFGLFHGIVFLPVILSLVGPKAYLLESSVTKIDPEKDAVNGKELVQLTSKDDDPVKRRNPS